MWRIVDIGGYGYSLSVENNKLVVLKESSSSEIPFRDINSIVIHCDCKITGRVFQKCIENCIPIVFCDEKHIPAGLFSPFNQNDDSAKRFEIQLKASKPRMKQAWMKLIVEKLKNQSYVLESIGNLGGAKELLFLSKEVLSGDSTNREAVGARLYFSCLFGDCFSRADDGDSINGMLNYGYTIIRSLVARVVSGMGLYPGIAVFHSNRKNPYALVDDLMEPLRPLVDKAVIDLLSEGVKELDSYAKRKLMNLIGFETVFKGKRYELAESLQHMAMTYVQFLERTIDEIIFPALWDY